MSSTNTSEIIAFGGGSGAAASIRVGNPVTSGGANRVLFEDGSQNLAANANLTYDGTKVTIANSTSTGLVLGAGAVGTPAIALTDADTGIFEFSPGQISFTTNGSGRFTIADQDSLFTNRISLGAALNAPDAGFRRLAAGVVGSTLGGANNGWIQNSAGELALNANYTNATAAFTNTNLSATVISGRTYNFTCCLFFSDSTAADGAQFDFNGGSAAMTVFRAHATAANDAGAALAVTNAASTALATAIQVALALTTQTCITIQGSFVPSGAGTFIVRAAQTAHSTGTLTVQRGSYISIRDASPL